MSVVTHAGRHHRPYTFGERQPGHLLVHLPRSHGSLYFEERSLVFRSGACRLAPPPRRLSLLLLLLRLRLCHTHGAQSQQCAEGRCTVWGVVLCVALLVFAFRFLD